MKKKIISALIVSCLTIVSVTSFAQNNSEAKTLFGSGNPMNTKNLGFFVAPAYGFTQMDKSGTSLINLRGGVNL